MADLRLNNIEDAVKDFKEGKFVIVVDDEDRENEGDLIIAAEKIDAETHITGTMKHHIGSRARYCRSFPLPWFYAR